MLDWALLLTAVRGWSSCWCLAAPSSPTPLCMATATQRWPRGVEWWGWARVSWAAEYELSTRVGGAACGLHVGQVQARDVQAIDEVLCYGFCGGAGLGARVHA